jgi:hypothetical protein
MTRLRCLCLPGLLVVSIGLAGCTGVEVSPSPTTWEDVGNKVINVKNTFNEPMAYTTISTSNPFFKIASTTCKSPLAVGASCEVVIRVDPFTPGERGRLIVESAAGKAEGVLEAH